MAPRSPANSGQSLTLPDPESLFGAFVGKPFRVMKPSFLRSLPAALVAAFLLWPALLLADVVELRGGSRLVGKITRIDGGSVVLATDFAGTVTLKQAEMIAITTDAPVAVRFANGTRVDGVVSSPGTGRVRVANAEGEFTSDVSKVAASWAAGGKDPAVAALERGWTYEASTDVNGKNGNKDDEKSADQFKAGVDYQVNFKGNFSWYVRDEGGFDRIKDIDLYNVAATGMGYDVIKAPKHTLTGRFGLSFRYEGYRNPATIDVKSAGLDFGFSHRLELANSVLVNRLTVVPTFEDFSNYRAMHESFYELPLANPNWKLRLGLANDYNSEPGLGVQKMDTSYFTRLVLNWR